MLKVRVCLDCGTPKRPARQVCASCGVVTPDHYGQPRESLCRRCFHCDTTLPGPLKCGFGLNLDPGNSSIGARATRAVGRLDSVVATQLYACAQFRQRRGAPAQPSPNPLSLQQRQEILLYRATGAFWLDPELWEGVDPHATCAFTAQAARAAKPRAGRLVAAAAVGLAAVLLSSRAA